MKINWNHPDLQKAYKPVPEVFQQAVSRTVRSVGEKEPAAPRKTGSIRRGILVPVLVSILLIAMAVACAVSWPVVMEWISDAGPVQELVRPLAAENSADGITARIDGIVFDGERFLFGYQVENADPALPAMIVINGPIRVNGREEGLDSTDAGTADPQIVPSPRLDVLPVTRNPVDGAGWTLPIKQELNGEVTCEIDFHVYRPKKSFVCVREAGLWIDALDEYDPDQQAEVLDSWEAMNSFRNVIIDGPEGRSPEDWFADGYTVIDSEGTIAWSDENDPDLYNMQETACIPVTIRFDASSPKAWDYSGTADIEREDCTVHIEKVRFSALSTQVTFLMIPKENTREAAEALLNRYGSWWLTDGQGNKIDPALYEKMSHREPDMWVVENWYEQSGWACACLAEFSGLDPWPESVGIVTDAGELIRFDLK